MSEKISKKASSHGHVTHIYLKVSFLHIYVKVKKTRVEHKIILILLDCRDVPEYTQIKRNVVVS